MRKIYDRDMTVDYTQRCEWQNGDVTIIRYGVSAKEMNGEYEWWRDVDTSYEELSRDGRKPGVKSAAPQQHFFNKRIEVRYEKVGGEQQVSGDNYRDRLRAQYAGSSTQGANQTTFPQVGGAGAGDRDTGSDSGSQGNQEG